MYKLTKTLVSLPFMYLDFIFDISVFFLKKETFIENNTTLLGKEKHDKLLQNRKVNL